jgi:VWFA-related protein
VLQVIHRLQTAAGLAIILFFLGLGAASAQQQANPQPDQKQEIPDAPSATRPPQTFPSTPPPESQGPPANQAPPTEQTPPPSEVPPSSAPSPAPQEEAPGPPPPFKITTVPPGNAPATEQSAAQGELYKLTVNVNQVVVPVRVTDESGRLVNGLLAKDFSVYEEGKKQNLNFFTSDPLAMSAAVIIDLGMADVAVQKVNRTFPALQGAFSQFDEVAIYTYSNTVARAADFSAVGRRLDAVLNELKTKSGENNGVPVTGGPLGPQGPTVNNIPVDPNVPAYITPAKQSRVLNDAILAAARDLSTRKKDRRKIIFVISDGKEYRSDASYSDVLKVLLSNGIAVYGVAVEGSAIPGYSRLERLHLPKMGYSDILPKYASATAGEVLSEYSRTAIENVYQRVIGDARNEYTLGYATRATLSSSYREVEVRVDRPGCKTSDLRPCILVYAKAGYYPLPVGR